VSHSKIFGIDPDFSANDPLVGKAIGGVIVFGGGPSLYSKKGELVGGLGVSGDTRLRGSRHRLENASRPRTGCRSDGGRAGPSDNMILDFHDGKRESGFGHPLCNGGKPSDDIIRKLNQSSPGGPK
jgi:hypothetical protein